MSDTIAFRDVAIIGGGCYGTFYASQLAAARGRGKLLVRSLLVVDRDPGCRASREVEPDPTMTIVAADWGAFLDEFLENPAPLPGQPDDAIVPSPLMPHLMAAWLLRVARTRWPDRAAAVVSAEQPVGTPYDVLAPDGTRYISFADWLCPTHCVEPHLCPVIRGPRTWEMSDALEEYAARLRRAHPTAGPALFVTRHRAFGVGMFDVAEARAARELLEREGERETDFLVGTVSSCHGAVTRFRLGR